jgi:hypothetical protein
MLRLLALAMFASVVVACAPGHEPEPRAAESPTTMQRPITPRSKLPPALLPLLPRRGVYAAGGGLMSSAWRVVLDLDAKTLYGGSAAADNAPSFGKMDKESTRPLTPANEQRLMQLAYAAWLEPRPGAPPAPTADYDEILIVLDGDDTFYVQGFGPIRRKLAAETITELRAAAGL